MLCTSGPNMVSLAWTWGRTRGVPTPYPRVQPPYPRPFFSSLPSLHFFPFFGYPRPKFIFFATASPPPHRLPLNNSIFNQDVLHIWPLVVLAWRGFELWRGQTRSLRTRTRTHTYKDTEADAFLNNLWYYADILAPETINPQPVINSNFEISC